MFFGKRRIIVANVRLVRSGQVHRSLVGHTGPVTALQFDDTYLVTGSLDRSIRVRISLPYNKFIVRPS